MAIEDVKVQGPCKKLYDKLKARNKMIAEFTNYPIIINNDLEDWIYFPDRKELIKIKKED